VAVRFTNFSQRFIRVVGLGTLTQVSVTCWVKISVDRNAESATWDLNNNAGSNFVKLSTATNGTTLRIQDNAGVHTLSSASVGAWTFVGFSASGQDGRAVVLPAGAAPTSFSWANGIPSLNTQVLIIGASTVSSQFLNGCVAAVKVWAGAALTEKELLVEARQYLPRRTAGLAAWYPFLQPDTRDYSGHGLSLTGGSGTSQEDGPPVRWSAGRRRIVVPGTSLAQKSLDDAGTAGDALSASAAAVLAESGTAADGLLVAVSPFLADAGSSAESLSTAAAVPLADSATGADLLSTGVPQPVDDAGSAAEAFIASAAVPLAETGTADEALSVAVTLDLADAGSGADVVTGGELLAKSLADAGSAAEDLSVIITREFGRARPPYVRWVAGRPVVDVAARAPRMGWAASEPESSWVARSPYVRWSAGAPVAEEVS